MDIKQQLELQAMYDRQAFQTAPVENAGGLTREAIEKMKKDDVLDLLALHGLDFDAVKGKGVGDLRAMLIQAMFVEE